MTPQDTRVLRRARRKAWRGQPTGRRATHEVKTTYGRHQKRADREARWAEFRERGYCFHKVTEQCNCQAGADAA